jgi:hypothetical protein
MKSEYHSKKTNILKKIIEYGLTSVRDFFGGRSPFFGV